MKNVKRFFITICMLGLISLNVGMVSANENTDKSIEVNGTIGATKIPEKPAPGENGSSEVPQPQNSIDKNDSNGQTIIKNNEENKGSLPTTGEIVSIVVIIMGILLILFAVLRLKKAIK